MSEENKEAGVTGLNEAQKAKLPELAEVTQLLAAIGQKLEKDAIDRDMVDKLTAKLGEVTTAMSRESAGRKAEWNQADATELIEKARIAGKVKAIDVLCKEKTNDPDVVKVQEVIDRSIILGHALKCKPTDTKYFQENLKNMPLLQKALNVADVGNAGVGGALTGWQPAEFTSRMIEKVRLQLVVAALHPRFNMPADPYRWPLEGGDATVYMVNEQGDADADLDVAKRVPTGISTTGAAHMIMSSKKLGCRVTLSNELDEDSFIPILPYLEAKISYAMAAAQENVTINGDDAGLLDGAGNYAANDQRLAWKGYRKYLESLSSKVSNGGLATIDIAKLREVRKEMGKYAIRPSDVVMLTGPVGYNKLLSLKDGIHPSPIQTLEKYGPNATILTGEVGRIDGIPVLVTEYMGPNGGENLTLGGTYDGITSSFTEILFIRPSAFLFGDRRQYQLKSREIIETDQQVSVVLQRLTFNNLYEGEKVVGGLVDIAKGA